MHTIVCICIYTLYSVDPNCVCTGYNRGITSNIQEPVGGLSPTLLCPLVSVSIVIAELHILSYHVVVVRNKWT